MVKFTFYLKSDSGIKKHVLLGEMSSLNVLIEKTLDYNHAPISTLVKIKIKHVKL